MLAAAWEIDRPIGALVNRVERTDAIAPWAFGAGALMRVILSQGARPDG